MGLEVTALRGHMAVLLSSALVWFYLIWSSFSALRFPGSQTSRLSRSLSRWLRGRGCNQHSGVYSTQECTVKQAWLALGTAEPQLCSLKLVLGHSGREQGTAADIQSTGRAWLINTASSVLSPAVAYEEPWSSQPAATQ